MSAGPASAAISVVAALAALAPSTAAGQPGTAPVEIVAAVAPEPGAAIGSAILVGRAGQLFHQVGPGRWQRRASGGVTVDLRGAVRARPQSDELFAVGAESPPFRFGGGAWRAEPLTNRGLAALSATGPLPVLAVGRHIYVLEGGAWLRRASAPRRVTAAWAAGPTELVVATQDGGLARWNGRRFAPLRAPLSDGEPIVALVGASPSAVFGRGERGGWVRIDRGGTAAIAPAADASGFEEHAWGTGPDASLWLAGTAPGDAGARRPILLRADGNRLVVAGDMPPLGAGDRAAVILGHPTTGELLVATRAGAVRVRDKKGTWTEGNASAALPARAARPGARSGAPARTR